ncbi:MAG: hypothetical protein SCALA702_10710 [Melioribacteraceae bacterium]|nr:MAG: hypothetical protein SCALA702_10710 [Melioribacteraceae bacterium]
MDKLLSKINVKLTLAGSISLFLYIITAIFSGSDGILVYMITNVLLFFIWFATLFFLEKESVSKPDVLKIIIVFSVLFRVVLLFSQPTTSDDVHRYLWEGKLVLNGVNPFEYTPDSEELEEFHSENLPRLVSYQHMTTIYPPVAQYIFAAGYLISGESDIGLKIIYFLFDLLTILVLIRFLKFKNLPAHYSIVYAWLPLTIMEYFINSHIDVAGVFFLVLLLYYFETGNYILASIPFALGVMVKLYPLMLIPYFLLRFRLKQSVIFFGIASIILFTFSISFIPDKVPVTDSFSTYMENWSFYGSFFSVLKTIFANETARTITYIMLVLVIGGISYYVKDIIKATYFTSISHVIFIPTLFPWYLGYLAVTQPFKRLFAVYWLFFALNLTNLTPLLKPWKEYLWVGLILYIPFFVLLIPEIKSLIKHQSKEHEDPQKH